jgi:hypothetical protein
MTLCNAGLSSIGYFYFDFRDEDKKNLRNLLLSLLIQLSAQSDIYCDTLFHLHSTHRDGSQTPSDDALMKCLKDILLIPFSPPIYLVMDALDECPDNSGIPTSRENVVNLIKNLVDLHLPNLHVCVTSRPEIDLIEAIKPLTSLRLSLHNQTGQRDDIVDYVTTVVYSDPKMRRWRKKDQELVVKRLCERADGM